jgi:hypothetical protein
MLNPDHHGITTRRPADVAKRIDGMLSFEPEPGEEEAKPAQATMLNTPAKSP